MAILFSLATSIVGAAAFWRTRCWTHPAVIFSFFWCAAASIPILAVPQAHASPWAAAFILGVVVAFAAPTFFMKWDAARSQALARKGRAAFTSPLFVLAAFALQLLPIPLALLNIRAQGFTFDQLASDPVMVACQYLGARYAGLIQPTVFSQLGTLLNYIGAPIAGVVLATRKSWSLRAVLFIVAFAPSLISVLVYADKGTVFQTAAYLLGGVVVGRVAAGSTSLITRPTIVAVVAGLIVIVPVMMLAMLNRGGGDCGDPQRTAAILSALQNNAGPSAGNQISDEEKAEVDARSAGMVFYLRSYAFSHMFAFSDWFDDYAFGGGSQEYRKEERPALGYWTFMAIGEKIDRAKEIPKGYYDEYFEEPGVLKSNIYTVWRGLIYDFTIPGALVFMAVLGWISSLAYRRMLERPEASVSQSGYITLAGFIYSTYLLSIFTWDSVYAAAIAVTLILWLTPRMSVTISRIRPR